jgi:uncharacterized repeat protein (TIGR03803 family)
MEFGAKSPTVPELRSWSVFCVISLYFCLGVIPSSAQTFTSLFSFDYSNGARPNLAALVQGQDGNFYGTTSVGGTNGPYGAIFRITPSGKLTVLHSFSGFGDGAYPTAGLVLGTDGNFYGTTEEGGGATYSGTVFKMTPAGTLTTLHSFQGSDGAQPDAALIQARDGNFYGTTQNGGTNGTGTGTVFKITPRGKLTTLYSFCSQPNCTDGGYPNASLVQASNGAFYGTTFSTVFKMTAGGVLTTLHTFNDNDGSNIISGLIQGNDGNFYGTANAGNPKNDGTVFKITPKGVLTTLHNFGGTDGISPEGGLLQTSDGNLYGTTQLGGTKIYGTVFEITLLGALTTLYDFCVQSNCVDGSEPTGSLLQATDGVLYGTTWYGGTNDEGTVFSVDVGLKPFILLLPNWGKVGATIQILGQGFNGITGVSFNGVAATYTVVSDTYLTAVVPAQSTTGYVTVETTSNALTSTVKFKVVPIVTGFNPPQGPIGTQVTITGGGFNGTTRVAFGGVKATSFKVNSGTSIVATVPTGAKTGKIAVSTVGGSASSKTMFTVTP